MLKSPQARGQEPLKTSARPSPAQPRYGLFLGLRGGQQAGRWEAKRQVCVCRCTSEQGAGGAGEVGGGGMEVGGWGELISPKSQ